MKELESHFDAMADARSLFHDACDVAKTGDNSEAIRMATRAMKSEGEASRAAMALMIERDIPEYPYRGDVFAQDIDRHRVIVMGKPFPQRLGQDDAKAGETPQGDDR